MLTSWLCAYYSYCRVEALCSDSHPGNHAPAGNRHHNCVQILYLQQCLRMTISEFERQMQRTIDLSLEGARFSALKPDNTPERLNITTITHASHVIISLLSFMTPTRLECFKLWTQPPLPRPFFPHLVHKLQGHCSLPTDDICVVVRGDVGRPRLSLQISCHRFPRRHRWRALVHRRCTFQTNSWNLPLSSM